MSDQQNPNADELASNLQNTYLADGQQGGYNYNAGSSYVPGQQYNNQYQGYNQGSQGNQGYQGYNQGYQGYQGYNQGYQGYNQGYNNYYEQPAQPKAMSLEDYQKQQQNKAADLNKKPVKRTLKLDSSSIKISTPKGDIKKQEEKKEPKVEKVEKPEETIKEKSQKEKTVKVESKSEKAQTQTDKAEDSEPKSKAEKIEAKKAEKVAKQEEKANAASVAALVKEQEEEVDQEVVNDMFGGKDHISVIFMGHVDAGKSTMGGNLLFLTGSVDKRTVDKYEREAKDAGRQGWYLSWVMDTNKEERSDGKTIEVGKAYFETDKRRYTILDAPGHKMYVSEMIGGASQADAGILVISARKGEYETGFEKGGQTREHALLAKTQGVNKLIVVVNKMDDPTVEWSEERYLECTNKLSAFLKGIGYQKSEVIFMPVSGYTGAGLKDRVDPKVVPWYKGPSLLEYLDGMETLNRKINSPFMLPIAGKMKDLGTIVEGKIESGYVKKNANLLLMPNKTSVEVMVIYNETENEADVAYCGEQVRLKLKNVEEEDVQNGFVLTSPRVPVKTATRFEAQVAIVELKSILSSGFTCVMHVHTAIEEVSFVELKHKLEKGTNRKSRKPPAFAKKGMKIIAVLETESPVCIETYEDYPQLGRFTLRDQGTTIAIGKVTKLLN